MAPVTFHLISVFDDAAFLKSVRSLPATERPYYLGHCEHWIHSPKTSLDALTGPGPFMQRWDYLLVAQASSEEPFSLPIQLRDQVSKHWSITAPVDDNELSRLHEANATRASSTPPTLPAGWSPTDHTGLDASEPPTDLEASLGLSATPFRGSKEEPPKPLKSFVSTFGSSHTGPINVFNIIAQHLGQRARFFGYIAAFRSSVGSRYGGESIFHGNGVTDWSSRVAEKAEVADPEAGGSGVWEDVALVWYPSLWHFAKMLDDPDYADADRKFKVGVVSDHPLLCCTQIEI